MWSAKIVEIKSENGQRFAIIAFDNSSDSTLSFTERWNIENINVETFKSNVKTKVDILSSSTAVAVGVIDTTPATPTQAEIDQKQFVADYAKWIKVKRAIDAGVLDGTETAVVNLKAKVRSEFKAAYLDLL